MRKLFVPAVLLAVGAVLLVALLVVRLPGRGGGSDGGITDAGTAREQDVTPTLTASGTKHPASAEARAVRELDEQIAALASDDAAAQDALGRLRTAMGEKRLSLEQMLRIALLEGLDGDAEGFRLRVAHHLWNQGDYRDKTPLFDPLLVLCLDPDPALRRAAMRALHWAEQPDAEMRRRVRSVIDQIEDG